MSEQGSLGDLQETPTQELRNAVLHRYKLAMKVTRNFAPTYTNAAVEHFGLSSAARALVPIQTGSADDFLDAIEIMAEAARTASPGYLTDFDDRVNDLFDRHRFGYRLAEGDAQRVGSPALAEAVVGPALLAAQRPGWEEVERSYREAVMHQRGGAEERDDALTAANAAIEAALKAAGLKGANIGPLAKSFRNSEMAPTSFAGVPEALRSLLDAGGALRHEHGDAHGKAPGASEVPQALADLAIHWAGSFIVYLASIAPDC